MSEKIDKLFRDNLESHNIHPRPELWERVEAGIGQKKEKKAIWIYYSVAAALLFLFALTVWLRWGVQPEMPNEMTLPVTNKEEDSKAKPEWQSEQEEQGKDEMKETIETPIAPRNREMAEVDVKNEPKPFEANEESVQLELLTPKVPGADIAYQTPEVMGDREPIDESIALLPEDRAPGNVPEDSRSEIRRYAESQLKNFLVGEPLDSPKGVIKMPEINIPFEKLLAGK
jgi:hypothetical protein